MTDTGRVYRLLIVDADDVDGRRHAALLARAPAWTQGLEGSGGTRGPDLCAIERTSYGVAGLEALRGRTFDCVLLDFDLPDMTGLEFLAAAAANGEPPCAVVLTTGPGHEAVAAEAMRSGAQDCLIRDRIDADALWRAIRYGVARTERRDRRAAAPRDPAPFRPEPRPEAGPDPRMDPRPNPPPDLRPDRRPDPRGEPAAVPAKRSTLPFDRERMEETVAFLPPADVVGYLRSLRARAEGMGHLLEQTDSADSLAEPAHALGSIAGMFGFETLSGVAHDFERAMSRRSPETVGLARRLRLESRAAMATLDMLLREQEGQAA